VPLQATSLAHPMFWFVVAAQCLGLLAVWFTRRMEGSSFQSACQQCFLASLGLVGLATIVAFQLGPNLWLCSGATFALMVVAAVYEFSPAPGDAASLEDVA